MKYAQINFDTLQMVGIPRTLPTRWTTSDGATINQFDKLPQEALYGLGWVPVVWEEIENAETHKYSTSPTYDEDNKQFVYAAVARSIDTLKFEACAAIDQAASAASARYITTGEGQTLRYLTKAAQAEAYIEAYEAFEAGEGDEPNAADYPFVQAEADACGEDCITRARYIVETAEAWEAVGATIESTRMGGKTNVNAATENAAVIEARDTAISTLEAI